MQIDTVTPGEATLLGQVRSITDQYLRYQPLVEKLCDSAMQQRHINLLLLELSLIDEYPRACTPSEVYAQATAGVETLLRQRSVRRNRSMSMSSFAAALVPNAVKDESGPGDNEPQLPVVSFTTLLKKAANTEENQAMVDSMWTMAVEEKKLVDRLEVPPPPPPPLRHPVLCFQRWDTARTLLASPLALCVWLLRSTSSLQAAAEAPFCLTLGLQLVPHRA